MQFSWVRQLHRAMAVMVMPRCRVIDKTAEALMRHTTSHDAGMIDTASVACTSDI